MCWCAIDVVRLVAARMQISGMTTSPTHRALQAARWCVTSWTRDVKATHYGRGPARPWPTASGAMHYDKTGLPCCWSLILSALSQHDIAPHDGLPGGIAPPGTCSERALHVRPSSPSPSPAHERNAALACDTMASGYMQSYPCHQVLPPMCAWWCRDLLAV